MLKGIDVSAHQNSMSFEGLDFVIIKASEGVGFKDKMLDTHYNNFHGSNDGKPDSKCYGFYHYARPDLGNSPEEEADWYLSLVGHHAGHALFALDWEGLSLKYPVSWAKRWLDRVYAKTGVKPLIYIQGSQEWTGKYQEIREADYGLWIAQWGVKEPTVKHWGFYAMWQYQGSPLDSNIFNGDVTTFKKYCGYKGQATPPKPVEQLTIKKGSRVKVKTTTDYNGVVNDKWVLNAVFTVLENVNGNRVVIGQNGQVTGAWHKDNLILV